MILHEYTIYVVSKRKRVESINQSFKEFYSLIRAKQIRIRHPNNIDNNNYYWHNLADQLCRVRTLQRGFPASTKTWIDTAQDRELWRQIVNKQF